MLLPSLARWILLRTVRHPWYWAWVLGVTGLWILIVAFGPLGITTRNSASTKLAYEVAFLSLLAGCSFGLDALSRQEWILQPLGFGRRVLTEWLVIALAASPCLFAGMLPLFWTGAPPAPVGIAIGVAATLLHLAAAASLILRLGMPAPYPALLLPLLVWILPALTATVLEGRLTWVLSARRPLSPTDWAFESGWGAALDPRPVLLLLLFAVLPTRRRALHALRHPR